MHEFQLAGSLSLPKENERNVCISIDFKKRASLQNISLNHHIIRAVDSVLRPCNVLGISTYPECRQPKAQALEALRQPVISF